MTIMEASPTKESDLFKGVSQRVLNEIGRKGEEMFFNKDSIIFSAEEEAAYIYELAEGTVDIVVSEGITCTILLCGLMKYSAGLRLWNHMYTPRLRGALLM